MEMRSDRKVERLTIQSIFAFKSNYNRNIRSLNKMVKVKTKISLVALLLLLSYFLTFQKNVYANDKNKTRDCPFSELDGHGGARSIENTVRKQLSLGWATGNLNYFVEKDVHAFFEVFKDKNCKTLDGRPVLVYLMAGFSRWFEFQLEDWEKIGTLIERKRTAFPEEEYIFFLEVHYWVSLAWKARGSAYARNVTEEEWRLFRGYFNTVDQLLEKNKHLKEEWPLWYYYKYQASTNLRQSDLELNKLFNEAIEHHPDFLPLYIQKRNYSRPRWGGSWQEVDQFINWSAKKTEDLEGMGMYARLYFGVYDNLRARESLYEDTNADWEKFKVGLKDLMRIYPKSDFHKNIFASMACEARDGQAFNSVRPKISVDYKWAWSKKLTVKKCDEMLGRQ